MFSFYNVLLLFLKIGRYVVAVFTYKIYLLKVKKTTTKLEPQISDT